MNSFSTWTFDAVEKRFGIKEVETLPLLVEWLAASNPANEHEIYLLNYLKKQLFKKAHIWNEDELKMFFIGPLIEIADIGNDIFQAFTQRSFSFTVNGEEIGGRVDFLIAKGRRVPELPFFCIHEYKQETDKDGEPLGQLLIAMVAAQSINEVKHPILGAYMIGRSWFFVVLTNNEYAKSNALNASDDDIFQIFSILKKSEEIIISYI